MLHFNTTSCASPVRGAMAAALLLSGMTMTIAAEIRIGGAGTALGTMREIGAAYTKANPDTKVTVLPSLGAIGGLHALLSGSVDIALATRALTEAEGVKRVTTLEIARTPFVFAIGLNNKSSDVTSKQLLEMYQLKLTSWPDGSRVRLVLRPPGVSDTIFLKDLSPQWKKAMEDLEAKPGMHVVAVAQEAADQVERTPGAITTSTINLITSEKRAMKALKIDGVEPNSKTVADGTYPYYKPVIVVTMPKATPLVQKFVSFVSSKTGRDILVRTGNVVLP